MFNLWQRRPASRRKANANSRGASAATFSNICVLWQIVQAGRGWVRREGFRLPTRYGHASALDAVGACCNWLADAGYPRW